MMKVYGFDSGTVNLGVCCVEYNENWSRDLVVILRDVLPAIEKAKSAIKSKEGLMEALTLLHGLVLRFRILAENIIRVKWLNNINLNIDGKDILVMSRKLRHFLKTLDASVGSPDLVLIEFQMVQNNTTNVMSGQIAYHYSDGDPDITYRPASYKIESEVVVNNRAIEFVIPRIKNMYHMAPDGAYANFISSYNSNKTANKNHTQYNFEKFMEVFGYDDVNIMKVNDISDAFMMIFGYLRVKNFIH